MRVPGTAGANGRCNLLALVAGMLAGVDTIDGTGMLRHGGMRRLFEGSGRPRRWERSCEPSPSVMSGSSTRWPAGY